jgi:hypothetical protein
VTKTLNDILGDQRDPDRGRAARRELELRGYDGLCGEECGCELDDFMPCGGEGALDCYCAHKHEIKDGKCEHRDICEVGDICKIGDKYANSDFSTTTILCTKQGGASNVNRRI